MTKRSIKKRKILEKITLHIKNDQDDKDVESSNQVNIEYIKQDLKEVIDYNRNVTLYHSDGSIVITPYYLKTLPDEILDKILGLLYDQQKPQRRLLQNNLYQLCFVNKQFYQSANRLLWFAPCISHPNTVDRFLTCLAKTQLKQQRTTRSLSLNDGKHHAVPHNILTAKHHIRGLFIIGEFWDNIQLSVMMPYLGLLETLKIKDDRHTSKITDAILHHLPRYCPFLITLSLDLTIIKRSSCLETMTQHCHHLSQLDLYIQHNDHQQQQCYDGMFQSLCRCRSLTTLRLFFTQQDSSDLCENIILNTTKLYQLTTVAFIADTIVTTTTLIDIFSRTIHTTVPIWHLLTNLRIDCAHLLNDVFMIPFIDSHPHITSLDLTGTYFSDATLNRIGTYLPHMTYIRLVGNHIITPNGVHQLLTYCRYLQRADFSGCNNLVHSMIGTTVLTPTQMKKIREHGTDKTNK